MKIIKILLLVLLVLAVFAGIRVISGDQGFIVALDQWLDQFQEQTGENVGEQPKDRLEQNEESEEEKAPSRVAIHKGIPAVKLSSEALKNSGISIGTLQVVTHLNEVSTTGKVVDFQPLLTRRADYQKATSDLRLAEESLHAAAKVYERLRALYKEQANISLRQVEEARLHMVEDQSRSVAAKQSIANIHSETLQEWGQVLTDWALGSTQEGKAETRYLERLLQKQDVLIMVTLPPDINLSPETSFIYVNTIPDRSTSRKAYLISPANYTDPVTQGVTYYFRTNAEKMRIGMRLTAWVVLSDKIETGVDVPLSSVIWYGGQPWVYVQVDDDLYSRWPVSDYIETDFGWFIKDTFDQDQKIVIRGGQLLLSEELRWQIPDEDEE